MIREVEESSHITLGSYRVLRLCTEANAKDVPCVHYSLNPVTAHSLYCLGKELFDSVRIAKPLLISQPKCDFSQLFGEDEESSGGEQELDDAEKQGENGMECREVTQCYF